MSNVRIFPAPPAPASTVTVRSRAQSVALFDAFSLYDYWTIPARDGDCPQGECRCEADAHTGSQDCPSCLRCSERIVTAFDEAARDLAAAVVAAGLSGLVAEAARGPVSAA